MDNDKNNNDYDDKPHHHGRSNVDNKDKNEKGKECNSFKMEEIFSSFLYMYRGFALPFLDIDR